MRNTLAILVVWLGWCAGAALAQNTAPLHLVQSITMDPSVEGKFDHMAVDVKGGRLFLTAPKHHSIEVFDLKSGKSLPSVTGLGKPAGIVNIEDTTSMVALDAANKKAKSTWPIKGCEDPSGLAIDTKVHKLFAACSNKVMAVVDSQNGKVLQTVPIGEDCDATAFEPGTGTALASNNDGTLTIVRAGWNGSYSAVQTLTLGNGSRTTGLDLSTHKLYVPAAKFTGPPSARPRPTVVTGSTVVFVFRLSASKDHATWITRTTIPSPGDRV
jgi:hypothetical protein